MPTEFEIILNYCLYLKKEKVAKYSFHSRCESNFENTHKFPFTPSYCYYLHTTINCKQPFNPNILLNVLHVIFG